MEVEIKIVGVVVADLEKSVLGTRSRLGDELGGRCVLARTVGRVVSVEGLDGVVVFCPAGQVEQVEKLEKMAIIMPAEPAVEFPLNL